MILVAERPHYIPTIDYFHKMVCSDTFVLADDILYTTGSLVNRTAIKSPEGKQWLTVPVLTRGKGKQAIGEVQIDPERNWRKKHWKAIYLNYKYAPYFEYYRDFFEQLYQKERNFS